MGVPALFQWVFYKFPKAIRAAKAANAAPVTNPSREEQALQALPTTFDCVFFDLNSMIHNCCHGSDPLPQDATEDDMILRIYGQLDEILDIVRPKMLVYIALDSVVPAGKLLQQRTRRFRTALDNQKLASDAKAWDSNVISPGTEFMQKVADALRWYIYDRCNTEENLTNVSFVLSDSSDPGEGEHKLIHYLKQTKETAGYDANTTHLIYSQDADLILLGLLVHNPHITLLREWQDVKCPLGARPRVRPVGSSKWDFVYLSVIREYLAADFTELLRKNMSFERVIDDFVLLCLLMGNDFLPSLPSVHVKEGALEDVITFYRNNFKGHLIVDRDDPTAEKVMRVDNPASNPASNP
eukprot:gene944-1435_t